jgi:hypothetical protein
MSSESLLAVTDRERPVLAVPHLPLARYRLDFRARDHITLPPFQGKVWQSAFGLALKIMSDEAAAYGTSVLGVYQYVFKTPQPPSVTKLRGPDTAPHPFVLGAEPNFEARTFAPRDTRIIELTLIGRGNHHAAVIFEAFARAAAGGLSKSRGKAGREHATRACFGETMTCVVQTSPRPARNTQSQIQAPV